MSSKFSLFYRKGIRTRLVAAFILIGILPFLIAGIFLSWHGFKIQKNQIIDQQHALTKLSAQSISSFFHEQRHLIAAHVKANFYTGIKQSNPDAKLREFLAVSWDEEHGYVFNAAYLIDQQGRKISHVSRVSIATQESMQNLSELDEFIIPFNNKLDYFSSIYFDKKLIEPLIKIAVPVIDIKTDQPVGVLVVIMKIKPIWNVISQLSIGDYKAAYVVDDSGAIVAHKNPSVVLSKLYLPQWNKKSIITELQNHKFIQTVERISYGGPPLYMVITEPLEKAYAYIYKGFMLVGGIFIMALLGAVVVGFVVLRKIILPIEEMSSVALKIAQGDYVKKASYTEDDELGDLASAFNLMTGNLVGAIRRVEHEKEFIHNAIEALPHPFIVFDAKDHSVVMENSAAQMYGAKGVKGGYALMHGFNEPCFDAGAQSSVDTVVKTKAPVTVEHVCKIKSGGFKHYEVNAYPIFDEQNSVIQVIEYIIDVTEKKALEGQLRQAKKLEALGSLAGGIAHDFNNLLTGIIGYAELTLNKLSDDSPLRDGVEIILESGERGAALTGQLLTFSRKSAPDFKVVKALDIVNHYKKIIKGMIGNKINLSVNFDDDLWNIKADAGQISQVLVNLSINARDAMQDGGSLTVNISNTVLAAEAARFSDGLAEGRYLKIVITDTGSGMSPAVKEQIFEPFFTTKGQYGTGLGLAIAYGVIKQHAGLITIESEEGVGTQVMLLLPATEDVLSDKKSVKSASMYRGNETVLIVDEDLSVLQLIKDILQAHGYTAHTALSGKEALNLCAKLNGQIDLVLAAVVMADIKGQELVDLLRQKYPFIKSMFMSGHEDDVLTKCNISREQDNFIEKPIRLELLLSSIRSFLDNKSAASMSAGMGRQEE